MKRYMKKSKKIVACLMAAIMALSLLPSSVMCAKTVGALELPEGYEWNVATKISNSDGYNFDNRTQTVHVDEDGHAVTYVRINNTSTAGYYETNEINLAVGSVTSYSIKLNYWSRNTGKWVENSVNQNDIWLYEGVNYLKITDAEEDEVFSGVSSESGNIVGSVIRQDSPTFESLYNEWRDFDAVDEEFTLDLDSREGFVTDCTNWYYIIPDASLSFEGYEIALADIESGTVESGDITVWSSTDSGLETMKENVAANTGGTSYTAADQGVEINSEGGAFYLAVKSTAPVSVSMLIRKKAEIKSIEILEKPDSLLENTDIIAPANFLQKDADSLDLYYGRGTGNLSASAMRFTDGIKFRATYLDLTTEDFVMNTPGQTMGDVEDGYPANLSVNDDEITMGTTENFTLHYRGAECSFSMDLISDGYVTGSAATSTVAAVLGQNFADVQRFNSTTYIDGYKTETGSFNVNPTDAGIDYNGDGYIQKSELQNVRIMFYDHVVTPITSLEPYGKMPNLEQLHITYGNPNPDSTDRKDGLPYKVVSGTVASFSSLQPLANCKNLNTIYFEGCYSGNSLAGLENLSKLKNVNISLDTGADYWRCEEGKGKITQNGLTALANKPDLEAVNLTVSNLNNDDLAKLEDSTKLTTLSLEGYGNVYRSVDALSGLTELTELTLTGGRLSNVDGIAGCTKLQKLELSYNEITDISALEELTNLTSIACNGNKITSIKVLENMTKLTMIYMGFNDIQSFDANLSGHTLLEESCFFSYNPSLEVTVDNANLPPQLKKQSFIDSAFTAYAQNEYTDPDTSLKIDGLFPKNDKDYKVDVENIDKTSKEYTDAKAAIPTAAPGENIEMEIYDINILGKDEKNLYRSNIQLKGESEVTLGLPEEDWEIKAVYISEWDEDAEEYLYRKLTEYTADTFNAPHFSEYVIIWDTGDGGASPTPTPSVTPGPGTTATPAPGATAGPGTTATPAPGATAGPGTTVTPAPGTTAGPGTTVTPAPGTTAAPGTTTAPAPAKTTAPTGTSAVTSAGSTSSATQYQAKNTVVNDTKSKGVFTVTASDAKAQTVEYKKPANKKAKTVKIPATVKVNGVTYKVTSIAEGAFKNNKKLKKITIESNINSIGEKAFYKCSNLKTIIFKTKLLTKKTVGKNAFKGIYKKAKITVPKSVKNSYKKILKARGVSNKAKIK